MEVKAIFRQSLPLLILCGIGEILAGSVFGGMADVLEQLPGLIVLTLRSKVSGIIIPRIRLLLQLRLIQVSRPVIYYWSYRAISQHQLTCWLCRARVHIFGSMLVIGVTPMIRST